MDKLCLYCHAPLVQRKTESDKRFARRRYCNGSCAGCDAYERERAKKIARQMKRAQALGEWDDREGAPSEEEIAIRAAEARQMTLAKEHSQHRDKQKPYTVPIYRIVEDRFGEFRGFEPR